MRRGRIEPTRLPRGSSGLEAIGHHDREAGKAPALRDGIMTARSHTHRFDGGAATYVGTGLLAFLITVGTLGIAYP